MVAAFVAAGWEVEFYPENMTDEIQVMDLVANGPFKQFMRRRRILAALAYFGQYKREAMRALVDQKPVIVCCG